MSCRTTSGLTKGTFSRLTVEDTTDEIDATIEDLEVETMTIGAETVNAIISSNLLTGASDYNFPTTRAIKYYVDNAIAPGTVEQEDGFENRTDSVITYDNITNTLTLTPVGVSFSFVSNSITYEKTVAVSKVCAGTEGGYFFYMDDAGDMSVTTVFEPNLILRWALVSYVLLDSVGVEIAIGDERHGYGMENQTHYWAHQTLGTMYGAGLTPTLTTGGDGSLDLHAQYALSSGTIHDEDIELSIGAYLSADTQGVMYRDGTGWSMDYSTFPVLLASVRLYFNEDSGGGVWTRTEVGSNNDFVLTHLFATNDIDGRRMIINLMGQAEYGSVRLAREGANDEMAALVLNGLPMVEWTPIATIIFKTNSSYTNGAHALTVVTDDGADYIDWRSKRLNSTTTPSDHGQLGGLADDDHEQYALANATTGRVLTDTVQAATLTSYGAGNAVSAEYDGTHSTTLSTSAIGDATITTTGGLYIDGAGGGNASKLNSTSTGLYIDPTSGLTLHNGAIQIHDGQLTLQNAGGASSSIIPSVGASHITVYADDNAPNNVGNYVSSSDTSTEGVKLHYGRTRGTNLVPTSILSNDRIYEKQCYVYADGDQRLTHEELVFASENCTASGYGSSMTVASVEIGATALTRRYGIHGTGTFYVGSTHDSDSLRITTDGVGNVTLDVAGDRLMVSNDRLVVHGGGGHITICPTGDINTFSSTDGRVVIGSDGGEPYPQMLSRMCGTTATNRVDFDRSRGTLSIPTNVVSGDNLLELRARSYGDVWSASGKMCFDASENHDSFQKGTSFYVDTCVNGATVCTRRFGTDDDAFYIGTDASTDALKITTDGSGNATLSASGDTVYVANERLIVHGSSGQITVCPTANVGDFASTDGGLIIANQFAEPYPHMMLQCSSSSSSADVAMTFRRSRGTIAAPTAVLSGDRLMSTSTTSYDGTAWGSAVTIKTQASENWSVGNHGASIKFQLTPNGGSSHFERLEILGDGQLNQLNCSALGATSTTGSASTNSYSLGVQEKAWIGDDTHVLGDLFVGSDETTDALAITTNGSGDATFTQTGTGYMSFAGGSDVRFIDKRMLLINSPSYDLSLAPEVHYGIRIVGSDVSPNRSLHHIYASSSSAIHAADHHFVRARGTDTTPLVCGNNDVVHTRSFYGYTGSNVIVGVKEVIKTTEVPTASNAGMQYAMTTCANGSSTLATRYGVYDGEFYIGSHASTDALKITTDGSGNATLNAVGNTINIDNERLVVHGTTGHITVCPTANVSDFATTDGGLVIANEFGEPYPHVLLQCASANSVAGATMDFRRSRGTLTAPGAVSSGDNLMIMSTVGHDGAGWGTAAIIKAQASETWFSGNHGSRIRFQLTPNGSSSNLERLEILGDGQLNQLNCNGLGATSTTGSASTNSYSLGVQEKAWIGDDTHVLGDLFVGSDETTDALAITTNGSGDATLTPTGGDLIIDGNLDVTGTFVLPSTAGYGIDGSGYFFIGGSTAITRVIHRINGTEYIVDPGMASSIIKLVGLVQVTSDLDVDGNLDVAGSLTIPTTSYAMTFTGPFASDQSITSHYQVVGKLVTISIPLISGTTDSNSTATNVGYYLPSAIRPTVAYYDMYVCSDNGILKEGRMTIATSGEISFGLITGVFTGSGNLYLYSKSYTYYVA